MSLMSVRNYQYLAEIPSLKNSLWTYFRFFLRSSFFVDFIVVLYIFHIFFFRSLSLSQFNVLFYFDVPWQQKVCCASLIRVAFSTVENSKTKKPYKDCLSRTQRYQHQRYLVVFTSWFFCRAHMRPLFRISKCCFRRFLGIVKALKEFYVHNCQIGVFVNSFS